MIPHSAAGVQSWGHPVRTADGLDGERVDNLQNAVRRDRRSERPPMLNSTTLPVSRPPAITIDLTTGASETQDREPPAKRIRLDPQGSALGGNGPSTSVGGEAKIAAPSPASRPVAPSWRGRPAWSFQSFISDLQIADWQAEKQTSISQGIPTDIVPPLPYLPLPERPFDVAGTSPSSPRDMSGPNLEVQTTPYEVEVPSVAPALKGDKVADFSPWTGNHPEDVLNEQTVKQGCYDRTQVSQNESNTARPSLYAQLKHRSGLQLLSSVFTAALERRQSQSMITAPSTFKPPPRVTLTDNKREAWLRDLANPSVPLRRLSRTIPHGIRGKLLLDQCFTKGVPIGRAVWLAKCVGANEIRAFKRKGTSGSIALGLEAKWVRDWTTSVQQFIEGVLNDCGNADWKTKTTYAVTLTARLYFEHLLDHDQYMDWLLSSLDAAPVNVLPFWLMLLGLYWSSLVQYRRRGRRLAEVLLEKSLQVTIPSHADRFRPLAERISKYVKRLVHEQASSLVLPDSWDKYKDTISSCLNLLDDVDDCAFRSLAERNARVQRFKQRGRVRERSPRQRIIRLLDSACSNHDINTVSSSCLECCEDRAALVSTLFEWTGTPFRRGQSRVYISVRLLRKWKVSGMDVDTYILSFLQAVGESSRLDRDNIFHVISELVRSQTFSVGRYLQWLTARGVFQRGSIDVDLLAQLPVSRLPEHVQNLRNTLLSRAGLSASQEVAMLDEAHACIRRRLPSMFSSDVNDQSVRECLPDSLTWAVRSEVGHWLRRTIAGYFRTGNTASRTAEVSAITPEELYVVRSILENFGDISMLADVLQSATTSDDPLVLASAADTLNYHFVTFAIIGASKDLFRRLIDAYTRLKSAGVTSQDLIYSLIEVGFLLPTEKKTIALLRQELARLENQPALAAASSPMSDHIPEVCPESDPLFQSKLEQILTSGAGMDELTMDTIFSALTKRLVSAEIDPTLSDSEVVRSLTQLRTFLPKHFDQSLIRWISEVLRSDVRPTLRKILVPLTGVGLVTLPAFVILLEKLTHSHEVAENLTNPANLPIELLELLVPELQESRQCLDLVSYRFRIARQEYLSKHSEDLLRIIHDTALLLRLQDPSSDNDDDNRVDFEIAVSALLRNLLLQSPESTTQQCAQRLLQDYSMAAASLHHALNVILGIDGPSTGQKSSLSEAEKAIQMTNDYSLPFCQLKLQALFSNDHDYVGEEMRNGLVDVMFGAAVTDEKANRSHWVDLVALMSETAVRQIRERAEKHLMTIPLQDLVTEESSLPAVPARSSRESAETYLAIIEELAYSIPDDGFPGIASLLVERLESLVQKLLAVQANLTSVADNSGVTATDQDLLQSRSSLVNEIEFWCSALLRLATLHRSAFVVVASSSATQKHTAILEQSRLLIAVFCLALTPSPSALRSCTSTSNYNFSRTMRSSAAAAVSVSHNTHLLDVAASFIDVFSDEARQRCVRFLRERCPSFVNFQDDPRFLYLLGPYTDVTTTATATATTSSPALPTSVQSPVASASATTPTPAGTGPASSAPKQSQSQPHQPLATSVPSMGSTEGLICATSRLRLQYRGRIVGPYPLRPWELLEDAAPIVGVNDTAVGLGLFDARRVRA